MKCDICAGRGYWQNPSTHDDVPCGNCEGTGKKRPTPAPKLASVCGNCGGKGQEPFALVSGAPAPCTRCSGTGLVSATQPVTRSYEAMSAAELRALADAKERDAWKDLGIDSAIRFLKENGYSVSKWQDPR